VAAAVAVTESACASVATLGALPENVELSEVDGLRVITEVVPSVRSVALGLWVKTGSRDEHEGQEGLSHFLEHLLFKAT
jgi:predicted Zn-dependent peptidase